MYQAAMKAVAVFFALLMMTGSAMVKAQEINTENPYAMLEAVANKTFERFYQDKAKIDEDPNYLKVIVEEELMPYIDYKYASYKVMGRHLRETTKEQRKAFVDAFEGYLVSTYAQAFTEYTDQKIEFGPARDFTHDKMVEVHVRIIEAGRPPIKLLFKVRRLKNNHWKAFDLVAEGVSLLASKQSEVTSLIRKEGIESVIEMLKQKTAVKISVKPAESEKL